LTVAHQDFATTHGQHTDLGHAPVVENTGITVTGAFDTKPTVTFPASQPPRQLIEQTPVAGRGTPVAAGDAVITTGVGGRSVC
jgi:hypothetical protein